MTGLSNANGRDTAISPSGVGVSVDLRRAVWKWTINVISIGVPMAGTIYWIWNFRKFPFGWIESSCFLVFYLATGVGIGIGFHRGMTHQSFIPQRWLKRLLIFCGTLAMQGSVIRWVADHRRHHRLADQEWDTHSPKYRHCKKANSLATGLLHAHVGWMFDRTTTNYDVYVPDLLHDKDCVFFHKYYLPIAGLSLTLPYLYGWLLGGSAHALSSLLVGGCLRISVFHNLVWGVNSIGHSFGKQDTSQRDDSRNHFFLAYATFGEGWHNNHHAAPRCAINQRKWYQLDFNGWAILLLQKMGWVSDVVKHVSEDRPQAEDAEISGDGDRH